MDALTALEEIATLLERELANPYKAKAFRKAAAAIEPFAPDDLAARIADGRLRRLEGIGATTYDVIVAASAGEVPAYLADLRAKVGGGQRTGLAAMLKGDLHSHSDWSDGTTSIQTMAEGAKGVGLEWVALTDHSPSLRVANGLSAERLASQLEIVEALDGSGSLGIRLLPGIEVDILEDGSLDQSPEMLDRLDVVVASVHSKLRTPSPAMTERMLGAIADRHTNVLGHCTGRLIRGSRGTRPQSTFDAEAVFAACAANDVAVEINSRPEREDPPDELIAIALAAGCLFSIDSDAHAPGHYGFLGLGAERAERAGIPPERIVTTWEVERLLEWTHRKR
ncbi:PHP domain-containing protein [Agromyces sp. LHK192]|uniref:PHP domain-containing protein n=1 Tax=Agromyces sp. LHK192 TaxID=2498704 RepID=UPI000FD73343|nr:PHP domain-containing protein [Agromyces sp. LHK192]